MQYFLKNFTMHHIQRHEYIQVFSRNREVAKVKMVMSKLKVNEKGKGGAMITINWMDVVKHNDMKVEDIYVFCFRGSQDSLNLIVDLPGS
jgi:hypothetical protein